MHAFAHSVAELYCGFPYVTQTADVWSCGVMLYVMLVGAYPFERPEDKHDNQKLQKMIQVRYGILFVWTATCCGCLYACFMICLW
jgi:serine/threonine protein kinase